MLRNKIRFLKLISLSLLCNLAVHCATAQTPDASFTVNADSGCAPLLVTFNNASTGAVGFLWNFGNGNQSTLSQPSASYSTPGSYTVTLIATSANGQRDTATSTITVLNNPVADFTVNSTSSCLVDNQFFFTNNSSGGQSYIWDFGDGSSSTSTNPAHSYAAPGNYTVKLVATNAFGCQHITIKNNLITVYPQPLPQLSITPNSSCDVNTVFQFTCGGQNISGWSWNFGDGSIASSQNPSHQYSNPGSYPVTLIASSIYGCTDTVTAANPVTIGTSLVPSFTASDSGGCAPFSLQFDCTVPNAVTWNWDFGDGNTSSMDLVNHTYTQPGQYTITLTVTTSNGCNGTVSMPAIIAVDGPPVTNFAVVQDSGCAPFTAQFVNLSTGAVTYDWQFGNSTGSSLQDPTATYSTGGLYSVTLTSTSQNGCQSSITRNQLIKVFEPRANFTASPQTGCPGMTTQFSHTGGSINIVGYFWNFGDGTTSNLPNPTHTFNNIGTYPITLIVTNIFGCKDTVIKPNYIHIISGTVPYTVPDTILVCDENSISFADPTIGSNTWNWNFGNGSGSTSPSASVLYTDPGIYTVTLQTSMPGGCSQTFNPFAIVKVLPYDPKPIDISVSAPCKPYVVHFSTQTPDVTAYYWDFGDGNSSTLANPSHTYQQAGTYAVVLTLLIGEGCSAHIYTTVTVGHSNPTLASSTDICLSDSVLFSLSNTAAFIQATWIFGDGNSTNGLQTQHRYAQEGTYPVYVITTDTAGCRDTFNLYLPVIVNNPLPAFTVPTDGCINAPLLFQNQSLQADTYFWDFGDGNSSNEAVPEHTYTSTGTYTVILSVTKNNCTVSDSLSNVITIHQPQSNFSFSVSGPCMPVSAQFNDLSSGSPIAWHWLLGNGDTSNQASPFYTYLTDPYDSIRLVVTDSFGCTDTSTQAPFPFYAAAAIVDDATGCMPHPAQFTDNSNGAITWQWLFGDGQQSSLQHPGHQYSANGIYTVQLIATFPGGCVDTATYTNMVMVASPVADFNSPTVAGCSPTQISFVNTTSDANTFSWSFGDGGTSGNTQPQHVYYIPGTYSVTLIATNSFGCSDTVTKTDYITIPGTYTRFSVSTISGCQGELINFTDSSVNASSWDWDFGDGLLDSSQHTLHAYADTGLYTVTLITRDSIGCTSSYTYPTAIRIHPLPTASATVSDTIGCSDFQTSFINLSVGASHYLWNFGDGDTSTQFSPSHTYYQAGNYQASLIATTSFGCLDTFSLGNTIHVLQSPAAHIIAADSVGCEPSSFPLTSGSTQLQSPSFIWYDGQGSTATGTSSQAYYTTQGTYIASLAVINANGCRDSVSIPLTVHPTPIASGFTDVQSGCNPLHVQFTPASSGASSHVWHFGNGDSSINNNPSYTYPTAGTLQPWVIASNNFGCMDSAVLSPLEVLLTPQASFTTNQTFACFGEQSIFQSTSIDTLSPSYFWDFGFFTSMLAQATVLCSAPGIFDVTLITTNSNGCSDTLTQSDFLEVGDTIPPAANDVAAASVIGDHAVQLTWFNSGETDVASYRLYRQVNHSGPWVLIHTDSLPANANNQPTTVHSDTAVSTLDNIYSYKLQTMDRCGYVLPLATLKEHTTMNVSAIANGLQINVEWTPYGGCQPVKYSIYRTERPWGNAVKIAETDSTTTAFQDNSITCPFEYEYRIEAMGLCGTVFNAYSDTAAAWPANVFAEQISPLIRTTVVDDKHTLTEWQAPTILPERIIAYVIERSPDGFNFSTLDTVPTAVLSYLDEEADVHAATYTYRIKAINDCMLSGPAGNIGKNILLQGSREDYRTYLRWNKYEQWDSGVDHYTIEQQDYQGNWIPVRVVNGQQLSTELDD